MSKVPPAPASAPSLKAAHNLSFYFGAGATRRLVVESVAQHVDDDDDDASSSRRKRDRRQRAAFSIGSPAPWRGFDAELLERLDVLSFEELFERTWVQGNHPFATAKSLLALLNARGPRTGLGLVSSVLRLRWFLSTAWGRREGVLCGLMRQTFAHILRFCFSPAVRHGPLAKGSLAVWVRPRRGWSPSIDPQTGKVTDFVLDTDKEGGDAQRGAAAAMSSCAEARVVAILDIPPAGHGRGRGRYTVHWRNSRGLCGWSSDMAASHQTAPWCQLFALRPESFVFVMGPGVSLKLHSRAETREVTFPAAGGDSAQACLSCLPGGSTPPYVLLASYAHGQRPTPFDSPLKMVGSRGSSGFQELAAAVRADPRRDRRHLLDVHNPRSAHMCPPRPLVVFPRPLLHSARLPPSRTAFPSGICDVMVLTDALPAKAHKALRGALDRRAARTADLFAPQYHNVVDPNLHLRDKAWVPSEFDVDRDGRATLVSGIHQLCPRRHRRTFEGFTAVFNAAVPLLARLSRPALLLPGRVQAVAKAQRIYLEDFGEEYCGIWHQDGLRERVVAVVLYYYRCSPGMRGGQLEFLAQRPMPEAFVSFGDGFDAELAQEAKGNVDRSCKVDVKEGTLVVFSNCQLVHRVLRMCAPNADAAAAGMDDSLRAAGLPGIVSRDFVAWFVLDQRHPLPAPPRPGPGPSPGPRDRKGKEEKKTTKTKREATTPTPAQFKERLELFKEQLSTHRVLTIGNSDTAAAYSTGNGSPKLMEMMSADRSLATWQASATDLPRSMGVDWGRLDDDALSPYERRTRSRNKTDQRRRLERRLGRRVPDEEWAAATTHLGAGDDDARCVLAPQTQAVMAALLGLPETLDATPTDELWRHVYSARAQAVLGHDDVSLLEQYLADRAHAEEVVAQAHAHGTREPAWALAQPVARHGRNAFVEFFERTQLSPPLGRGLSYAVDGLEGRYVQEPLQIELHKLRAVCALPRGPSADEMRRILGVDVELLSRLDWHHLDCHLSDADFALAFAGFDFDLDFDDEPRESFYCDALVSWEKRKKMRRKAGLHPRWIP